MPVPPRSFSFVQLSDLHLVADEALVVKGARPNRLFRRAVEQIASMAERPAFCVLTGDLIGDDDPRSYDALREALAPLSCPVHFALGNHDFLAPFIERVTGETPQAGERWTRVFDHGDVRFVILDSRIEGEDGGALGVEQLAWLSAVLDEVGGERVALFVHHPPCPIGVPWLDAHALADSADLFALLERAPARVEHVFFGHAHMPVHVVHRGIACTGIPSTCYQFTDGEVTPKVYPGTPSYALVRVDVQGITATCVPIVEEKDA